MGDEEPIAEEDLDVVEKAKPKGGKPKGYVPLRSNASVKPLPKELEELTKPPPTATDGIVYEPYKTTAAVPAEEGSAEAEEIKKKKSMKDKSGVLDKVFRAKEAADVVVRADRIGSLLENVQIAAKTAERDLKRLKPKIAEGDLTSAEKKVIKRAKESIKTAEAYSEFSKEDVDEGIAKKKKYPLVQYQEQQQANEENVGQYAKNIEIYMPATRKAFLKFIQAEYAREFTLKGEIKEPDPLACQKLLSGGPASVEPFRYQRFIKEYIRQSSPYRGLLVYHGLGSGKTCSSIAAAEALYGIANKKIIVMTPQSLRDNFIKEISFCGFKHFSLHNHWTKIPLLERVYNEKTRKIENEPRTLYEIYGRSVLSLGSDYIRRIKEAATSNTDLDEDDNVIENAYLWVPDFDKEPNFHLPKGDENALTPTERDQIKSQLNETINNRFHFINYNGISNAKLKEMCCKGGELDNAVIVVDEIHNLTRLMRGKIEPFLFQREGRARSIRAEPVEPGRWIPKLCGPEETKKYSRGYMFYRLFIGAKNSKIVGLSGTPLINFPEELGVLANILAGYIDCITLQANTLEEEQVATFTRILDEDPRVDFVRLKQGVGNVTATISVFQEGYVKVLKEKEVVADPELEEEEEGEEEEEKRVPSNSRFLGVQYSDEPEAQLTIQQVADRVLAACKAAGIPMNPMDPEIDKPVAYPRLPPDQESFRAKFIDMANETVRPDMKLVLQKRLAGLVSYYKGAKADFLPTVVKDDVVECDFSPFAMKKYVEQRTIEIGKEVGKKPGDKAEGLYAAVEVYAKSPNPSSYRFRSRACCNFAFPFDRPYPVRDEDINEETSKLEDLDEDNLEEDLTEEQEEERKAAKKKLETELEEEDEELEGKKKDKGPAGSAKEIYQKQLTEALVMLNKDRDTTLTMKDTENGLKKYSSKLYEMLLRMEDNPGPSLVYSAFEQMEGLGVLSAALQANGYEEIKFTGAWFGAEPSFTPESLASLAKGPDGTKRFMAFSGKVDRRQRRVLLGMLNSQWSDVPKGIQRMLRKGGFDLSKKYLYGEVIKCIGITGAGAEGISLRNVRQVHIYEPFWNLVRLEQVKGRAIRICSHMDLPLAERNVDIFTYVSRFSPDQIAKRDLEGGIPKSIQEVDGDQDPETKQQRIFTSDQKVLDVALRKEKIAKELLDLMKEVAVDCALNAPENATDKDKGLKCLVIEEGDNPYMFDPDLEKDEITTGAELAKEEEEEEEKPAAKSGRVEERTSMTAAEARKAPEEVKIAPTLTFGIGGKKRTILIGDPNKATGIANVYDELDQFLTKPIGTIRRGARAGSTIGWSGLKFF
jgi:hypothetical protein